jgi:tRNA pseudouridine55 synthase
MSVRDANTGFDRPVQFSERDAGGPCQSSAGLTDSGVLVVDKPDGMTSFDVVAKLTRRLKLQKAGHCGTLDPLASGVLVVCVNQATRIADQILDQDKVYRFTVHFGVETDTLDGTGTVVRRQDGEAVPADEVRRVTESFRGKIQQNVPSFSAVKVRGSRLYHLARNGVKVELPPREVEIRELDMVEYAWPRAVMETRCSKGTYIRQLASDIGSALGCGAHACELRRLASGSFRIEQAASLDEVIDEALGGALASRLIPMNEALVHLREIRIEDAATAGQVIEGHLQPSWEETHRQWLSEKDTPVRLVDGDNRLLALWWPWADGKNQRKLRVFKMKT